MVVVVVAVVVVCLFIGFDNTKEAANQGHFQRQSAKRARATLKVTVPS